MSNKFRTKCNVYAGNSLVPKREIAIAAELNKALLQVKYDDNFWFCEWMGYKINMKPIICNGLSFVHNDEMLSVLCDIIIRANPTLFDKLQLMTKDEYLSGFTLEESHVYESLISQFNSPIPCITRYLINNVGITDLRKIMCYFLMEFASYMPEDLVDNISFTSDTVCNTEAFSYFLSMYWVFQKSRKLQMMFMKNIRTVNFPSLLSKLCPKDCLHFKYVSGQISSQELYDKFNGFSGDSESDSVKELRLLFDLPDVIDGDTVSNIFLCTMQKKGFEDFISMISCAYFTMFHYEKDKHDYTNVEEELEIVKSSKTDLSKELSSLRIENKSLTQQVEKLSNDLNNRGTDSVRKDLQTKLTKAQDTISSLNKEISDLKASISAKERELAQSKRTIRSQTKEIKSLNARLDELGSAKGSFFEKLPSEEVETPLSVEDMAKELESFRFAIFGGYNISTLVTRFEQYNLSVKNIIDEQHFDVGYIDCAIVLTSSIKHRTVKNLQSKYDGVCLYTKGTNVEAIITELYKKLIKEA